jgi:hypothetical protein
MNIPKWQDFCMVSTMIFFVLIEMFPYNTLQDILEQAKRTSRGHGRSSQNRSTTPWTRSQPSASHGGSQF